MNFCKFMQKQVKYTKATWSSTCGVGGRVKFAGARKRSSDGKDFNTIVVSSIGKDMKLTKISKAKAKDDSDSDDKAKHFDFENVTSGKNPSQNEKGAMRNG